MERYGITFNEACTLLGISRPTLKKWIDNGRIAATRKDPTRLKSPYIFTKESCLAALHDPNYKVIQSAQSQTSEPAVVAAHARLEETYVSNVRLKKPIDQLRFLLTQRTKNKNS